ncbi:putative quinol monooxygenase [Halovulum sp. GXIMD14793]
MAETGQVRLTGTIIIPMEEQAQMQPLLDAHIRLTRQEPGCLLFEVTQDDADPAVFHVSELFEDQAAFDFHQTRGGASPWGQQSGHLVRDFKRELL